MWQVTSLIIVNAKQAEIYVACGIEINNNNELHEYWLSLKRV